MTESARAASTTPTQRERTAPAWLHRLLDVIDALGRFGGAIAALSLAALTLLILAEITVRMLSNYIEDMPAGVPMAWEFSSYLMGIAFMAGAAMTLRAGGHIRVSILTAHLPVQGQRLFEVIASAIGLLLTSFLAYSLVMFSWGSYSRGQTSISSDTPVWIPEAAITFGAILLALQMLARLLQALWGLPVEDPSLKAAARWNERSDDSIHQAHGGPLAVGAIVGTLFAAMFSALAAGLWIGLTLMLTALVLLWSFRSIPLDRLLPQYAWNILTTSELVALPLFIVMGEILFRTRLASSLFKGLAPWAGLLPGRLLHVNVAGCSMFAAISGSSAATTQVVGRISLDELQRRGYAKEIAIGSLAGAGTLGFLIPPSNILIIYGVLAEVSILKLFIAGFIPGMLLALTFMGYIMLRCTLQPELVPPAEREMSNVSWARRWLALRDLGPTVFLIFCVLGSMYAGIATPSEAAAVGVLGALIISAIQGDLNWAALQLIGRGAVLTCSMIGLIVLGASILGSATAFLGIPGAIAEFVGGLGLSPLLLIVVLVLFYLLLGCFLDGFSMIVMTLPIVMPIITAAGYDPIWFGIFLVLVVEMSQITPPVGFNLFVIQSLTGEGLGTIARMTLPFLLILALFAVALAIFPGMALWLPAALAG